MVKSAERAVRILETVGRAKEGLTHTELSQALSIPSGSLTPLLNTLFDLGYLSLDLHNKKRYVLGAGVLFLSNRYQKNFDMVQVGEHFLAQLVSLTGETAAIAIESGDQVMVIAKKNTSSSLRPSLELGGRAPLYAGASGKIFLAHRSDEEISRYLSTVDLKPLTPHTIIEPDKIWNELEAIRKGALSYSREAMFEGVTAVAAPVKDMGGKVVATLLITGPTTRLGPEKEAFIEKTLREAAAAFSQRLGFGSGECVEPPLSREALRSEKSLKRVGSFDSNPSQG
jgi:DNA-binding IclR family transcriptional regulator